VLHEKKVASLDPRTSRKSRDRKLVLRKKSSLVTSMTLDVDNRERA
jgi:hypothetical protein